MICFFCGAPFVGMHGYPEACIAVLRARAEQAVRERDEAREKLVPETAAGRYRLVLDRYELVNLFWLLQATERTHNSGDWHGQVRWKMADAAGVPIVYGQDLFARIAEKLQQAPNLPLP